MRNEEDENEFDKTVLDTDDNNLDLDKKFSDFIIFRELHHSHLDCYPPFLK